MEKISFGENQEQSERELKKKIDRAVTAALTNEEYEQRLDEFRILCPKYLGGSLSAEEESRYHDLLKSIDDCVIMVSSIMEYKKLLELIPLDPKAVNETLAHENAHANMAESLPTRKLKSYVIRFYKDGLGKVCVSPSVISDEDFSFPEKQILEERIKVSHAPMDYGQDPLSPQDEKNIKEAEQRLSELEN